MIQYPWILLYINLKCQYLSCYTEDKQFWTSKSGEECLSRHFSSALEEMREGID